MTERSQATIQHGLASEDASSILSYTCEGGMTSKATGHHTPLDHKYFMGPGGAFLCFFQAVILDLRHGY